jgi:hypothetical protein
MVYCSSISLGDTNAQHRSAAHATFLTSRTPSAWRQQSLSIEQYLRSLAIYTVLSAFEVDMSCPHEQRRPSGQAARICLLAARGLHCSLSS